MRSISLDVARRVLPRVVKKLIKIDYWLTFHVSKKFRVEEVPSHPQKNGKWKILNCIAEKIVKVTLKKKLQNDVKFIQNDENDFENV